MDWVLEAPSKSQSKSNLVHNLLEHRALRTLQYLSLFVDEFYLQNKGVVDPIRHFTQKNYVGMAVTTASLSFAKAMILCSHVF